MIIDLYDQVMKRSDINVNKTTKQTVSNIVDYALEYNGSILQIRDKITNKITYASTEKFHSKFDN